MPKVGAAPPNQINAVNVPMDPTPMKEAHSSDVKVSELDARKVSCTADTLTFAALSKKHYGSPRYAKALLNFNRDFPHTAGVQRDPPVLKVGDTVVLPAVAELESRYPRAIPADIRKLPATPPISIGAKSNSARPQTLPAAHQTAKEVVTQASNSEPVWHNSAIESNTPVYVVQGKGEMLYEIARKTLGDGRRWSEIYRLNPQVRPQFPIPEGTRLQLPMTARVPQ